MPIINSDLQRGLSMYAIYAVAIYRVIVYLLRADFTSTMEYGRLIWYHDVTTRGPKAEPDK